MSLRPLIGILLFSLGIQFAGFSQTNLPLTILHINDMHARVTPHMFEVPSMNATGKFERVGGAAYLASKLIALKSQYPNSLVLDAGDITEGNPLGDLRGDGAMVDFLNLLDSKLKALGGRGIDASLIGNHDYRDTNYLNSIKHAKYPVLSINLRYKKDNSPVFKPYVIDTVNGQIIGIIGYTKDDEPPVGTNAETVIQLLKCQWSGAAAGGINIRDTVQMLRTAKHCDLVILLAHDAESRLCENSNALIVDDGVVKQPEVAITGHWHTMTSTAWRPKKLHDKTIMDEAASYMEFIGQLDVDSYGKYVADQKYAIRCDSIVPDPDVATMVDSLVREYNGQGHAHQVFDTIGYTAVDLRCDKGKWWSVDEYPWYGDETAGEWICDGLQWKINQMNLGFTCDLAVQAGGGIRKDVPKGPITYMDVYEVYPWNDDSVAVVKMSGQDIFNYIQSGSLDVDLSQGWHVTGVDGIITSLTHNGQTVNMTDSFYVGISNYMWDNATAGTLGRLVYRSSTQLIRDGIIDYTAQFTAANPMQVPGPRYDINNKLAGEFDAVVTMVADTESEPQYDNGFLRLLKATPATLSRLGSMYVPASLVNHDGSINHSHQMCESMWYRSQLGIPTGVFHPGDIIRFKFEGGFYAGNPEYIEEDGIFSPDSDFQIIGHDTSLIHPAYMPDINSFWNEQMINHYVMFYATKTGNNSVRDSKGQIITLYQPGGYNAVTSLPGNLGDVLEIRGVQTTKNTSRLFRVGSVRLASDAGVVGWMPSSSIQPIAQEQNNSTVTLYAVANDPQATTQSVQITAAADAYVVSGKPTSNYGTATGLYCQWQDSGSYLIEQPYMRFLLNSLPQNISIQNAKLRMYAWKTYQTMPIGCFAFAKDTNWTETGIKWNNKPALDDLHRLDSLTVSSYPQYYEWNVTNYVKQKYTGNDSVNLSVKSLALNRYAYCNFESREYSSGGYGPFLQIDYTAGKDNSGIAKVDFFFRYSPDNQTWGPWTLAGSVTSTPYNLQFTFANGKGYYQFYSIATDLDGNVEPAPIDPDASCFFNPNQPPKPDIDPLPLISGECHVDVTTAPTAKDQFGNSLKGTTTGPTSFDGIGNYVITWTFTDTYGNSATQNQTVNVYDHTAPVVGDLPTITGQCSVQIATAPTAIDNCAGTITATTTSPLPLVFNQQGTYSIIWTFSDGHGNSTAQSQKVIVADNQAPVPDNSNLPDITGTGSVNVTVIPTATDNCAGHINGTTSDPLTYNQAGTYYITWNYSDGNGNSSSQQQKVIVLQPDRCIANLAASTKLNQIQLTWTNNGSSVYHIYRSTESATSGFQQIAVTSNTYSTYLDTGLIIGQRYWYKVYGDGACGNPIVVSAIPQNRVTR